MSKHPREIVEEMNNIDYWKLVKIAEETDSGCPKFERVNREIIEAVVNSHIETLEQEIEFLESQFEMAKSTKQFVDKCRWNDCLNAQISHLQQQLSEWRLMK